MLAAILLTVAVGVASAQPPEHPARKATVRRPGRQVSVRNKRVAPPDRMRARDAPRGADAAPVEVVKAPSRPSAEW